MAFQFCLRLFTHLFSEYSIAGFGQWDPFRRSIFDELSQRHSSQEQDPYHARARGCQHVGREILRLTQMRETRITVSQVGRGLVFQCHYMWTWSSSHRALSRSVMALHAWRASLRWYIPYLWLWSLLLQWGSASPVCLSDRLCVHVLLTVEEVLTLFYTSWVNVMS